MAAVLLLCVVQLLLALVWSVLTPTFRGPAELHHVDRALQVGQGAGFAGSGSVRLSRQVTEAAQLAQFGGEASITPARDMRFRAEEAHARSARPGFAALATEDRPSRHANPLAQQPPLHAALFGGVLAALPATTSFDVQVWLLRVVGAFLVAPLPLLAFAATRCLVEDRRAALAAAAVPLAVPLLAHAGGAVGSAALLALLGGVFVFGLARLLAGQARVLIVGLLGASAGLALLTQTVALAWLPAIPLAAAVAAGRGSCDRRRARAVAIAALVVAAAVGGWWYVRGLEHPGARQTLVGTVAAGDDATLGGWLVQAVAGAPLRFWGQFGWQEFTLPWWLVAPLSVLALVCAVAVLRSPRSMVAGCRAPALVLLWPLLASAVAAVAGTLVAAWTDGGVAAAPVAIQGPYPLGGLVGVAVVVGVGAVALAGWRTRWVPPGLLLLAATVQTAGGWLALRRWWGPADPDTVAASARALVAWSPLPPLAVALLAAALATVVAVAVVSLASISRTARPARRPQWRLGD